VPQNEGSQNGCQYISFLALFIHEQFTGRSFQNNKLNKHDLMVQILTPNISISKIFQTKTIAK
jgi:hypothetical protein